MMNRFLERLEMLISEIDFKSAAKELEQSKLELMSQVYDRVSNFVDEHHQELIKEVMHERSYS